MGPNDETTSYFLSWKANQQALPMGTILEIRKLDSTFCFPSQHWHYPYYLVLLQAPGCANSWPIEKNSGGHMKSENKNLEAWNMEVKEF